LGSPADRFRLRRLILPDGTVDQAVLSIAFFDRDGAVTEV
jgi:hypothetical protein